VLLDTRPLRECPAFRRLWLGTTASGFGSQIGSFAVTYHVWDRTHNAALVGLIGLFVAAPMVGVALAGSAFLDHADRRRLALVATWGQIVTGLALAAVVAWSRDGVWPMLVLVGIASGFSALGAPARHAFVPRLLPPDRLAAGLALNHLSFQLAMLLGPALAGVVTAQWGTTVCFLIDAATFVAALVGVAGLPATEPAEAMVRPGLVAVWEGLRFTAGTHEVRGALLSDLTATILAMPMALFPVINQEKFGGSPEVLGLLFSAVAVGGVLASALSGVATQRDRPGLVLLSCGAVWGASLALVGASDQLAVVLALLAVAGGADTWAVVSRGTVVQASTPESHRGRVAALEQIVGVAGPHIGNLRAGLVAAGTSGGTSLVIGGATGIAGIGLIAALVPQLRRFTVTGSPSGP
jgi:MFS family permease